MVMQIQCGGSAADQTKIRKWEAEVMGYPKQHFAVRGAVVSGDGGGRRNEAGSEGIAWIPVGI
jgi:hypothetical protein